MTNKQIDSLYEKLMARGQAQGGDMYFLEDKQITLSIKNKVREPNRTRMTETFNFYLRHKADVTGHAGDKGWILKDKRPTNKERGWTE